MRASSFVGIVRKKISLQHAILCCLCLFTPIVFPVTTALPQGGWVGQGQVNEADTLYDVGGRVDIDSEGNAWVVWIAEPEPGFACKVFVTKWTGAGWGNEQQVTPTDSLDPRGDFVPEIAVDDRSNAWVVWHRYNEGDTSHIFYSMWDGAAWSEAEQVDTSQSRYNWAPFIDFGGGELWAVWYGGGPGNPYDIYCSHWDGTGWEPEMQVSPVDTLHHWFTNMAVDGEGRPHVAWSEYWSGCVYYSMYDGYNWTPQFIVNDTSVEHGYFPSIAVDNDNHVHIAWVGYYLDPITDVDIFYRKFDGINWSEEVMINEDDTLTDYMPRIAATSDSNIWVAWIDEDSSSDLHIHCRSFNGTFWTMEEELDDDRSYLNDAPSIALDTTGYPWVVWNGHSPASIEIYYNRYKTVGIVEEPSYFDILSAKPMLSVCSNPFHSSISICYTIFESTYIAMSVYDSSGRKVRSLINKHQMCGKHITRWDGTDDGGVKVPSGIYYLNLGSKGTKQRKKLILLR